MTIGVGSFSNETGDAQFANTGFAYGSGRPASALAQLAIIGPKLFGFSPKEANASIAVDDLTAIGLTPRSGGRA